MQLPPQLRPLFFPSLPPPLETNRCAPTPTHSEPCLCLVLPKPHQSSRKAYKELLIAHLPGQSFILQQTLFPILQRITFLASSMEEHSPDHSRVSSSGTAEIASDQTEWLYEYPYTGRSIYMMEQDIEKLIPTKASSSPALTCASLNGSKCYIVFSFASLLPMWFSSLSIGAAWRS